MNLETGHPPWSIAYGNGIFVVGSPNGGFLSKDGINWSNGPDYELYYTLAFGDGRFLKIDAFPVDPIDSYSN